MFFSSWNVENYYFDFEYIFAIAFNWTFHVNSLNWKITVCKNWWAPSCNAMPTEINNYLLTSFLNDFLSGPAASSYKCNLIEPVAPTLPTRPVSFQRSWQIDEGKAFSIYVWILFSWSDLVNICLDGSLNIYLIVEELKTDCSVFSVQPR